MLCCQMEPIIRNPMIEFEVERSAQQLEKWKVKWSEKGKCFQKIQHLLKQRLCFLLGHKLDSFFDHEDNLRIYTESHVDQIWCVWKVELMRNKINQKSNLVFYGKAFRIVFCLEVVVWVSY